MLKFFAIFSMMVLFCLAPRVHGATSADSIKPPECAAILGFDVLRDAGTPVVHVKINGTYDATFFIDTGSFASTITPDLAKKLRLKTGQAYDGQFEMGLTADGAETDYAVLPKLSVGSIELKNYQVVINRALAGITDPEQKTDGSLGIEFLSFYATYIDFPNRTIAFFRNGKFTPDELKGLGMDTAFAAPIRVHVDPRTASISDRLINRDNRWEIQVTAKKGEKSASEWALMDTGAPTSTFGYSLASMVGAVPEDRTTVSTMQDADDFGTIATLDELGFSSFALKNRKTDFLGDPHSSITPLFGDDILGYGTVLFDFPGKTMYYKPTMAPIANSTAVLDVAQIDKSRLIDLCTTYSYGDSAMATPDSGAIDDSDPDGHIAILQAKIKGSDLAADAKNWKDIGDAYYIDLRYDKAKTAYDQCVALRRQLAASKPSDPDAQADLANALIDATDFDEALKTAQDAVAKFPNSSQVYQALGSALFANVVLKLDGSPRPPNSDDDYVEFAALINKLRANPPSVAFFNDCFKAAEQAKAAYDKSVQLDPANPKAYIARANFMGHLRSEYDYVVEQAFKSEKFGEPYLGPGTVFDDYDKAAELRPYSVETEAAAAGYDDLRAENTVGLKLDYNPGKLWNSLPRKVRNQIQAKSDALTQLSTSPDAHVCAEAFDSLGSIQHDMHQDNDAAFALFRQALDKDPADGSALIDIAEDMSQEEDYADLLVVLNTAVAKKDCALTRLLIARTENRLGDADSAMAALVAGLALKPDSFSLNLAMAYQLLALQTPDSTAKAKANLDKAQAAIGSRTHTDRREELEVAWGIYQSLAGDVSGARDRMVKLLDWFPTNTAAREIIAAGTFAAPAPAAAK